MQLQQSAAMYTGLEPWKAREVSYGLKLVLMTVCVLLTLLACVAFAMILIEFSTFLSMHDVGSLVMIVITLALLIGCAVGLFFLVPRTRMTTRWVPKTPIVPTLVFGQPFEVRFRRTTFRRSLRGKGFLRFDGEGWTLQGYLEPNALFQIGVMLVVTFVPLIIFHFGLGIIPALILAYYLGRKKIVRPIHYGNVQDLTVRGCEVRFRSAGPAPNQIIFDVSSADGERLYRELYARFPTALGGWIAT